MKEEKMKRKKRKAKMNMKLLLILKLKRERLKQTKLSVKKLLNGVVSAETKKVQYGKQNSSKKINNNLMYLSAL